MVTSSRQGEIFMLTHQQILHFNAFGYVVMRGLLSQDETATLRREVTDALTDAFGQLSTEPNDLGGISGDYLPLTANRAPFCQSLVADDRRTFLASAELLGGPTVPGPGTATCYTGDSSWHTRQGRRMGGVTFWIDTGPRTADTGALRFIPGSHLPEFWQRLCAYGGAEPVGSGFEEWEWPHVVVETEPGDVVAFHVHLMTCNQGGLPRLTWTIEYRPWPGLGDPDQMRIARDFVLDDGEYDHEDYDRDRWPVWRDWAGQADPSPSRQLAIDRLKLLGVLPDGGPG
jgi:hypothetical protein